MTVDPGANTGWAFWTGTAKTPDHTGVFSTTGGAREARLVELFAKFEILVARLNPRGAIIEGVEFWGGSLTSTTAAKTGDLFQLAYTVGGYVEVLRRVGVPVQIIPARLWKGQLDKVAIHARIQMALRRDYREHEADAVAMGLSIRGHL